LEGVFVCGWARNPSTGLVGIARKDGVNAGTAIIGYLQRLEKIKSAPRSGLNTLLKRLDCPVVNLADLGLLTEEEAKQAEARGIEDFKFSTNEEMLDVMGFKELD
jgi:hypothetical protein